MIVTICASLCSTDSNSNSLGSFYQTIWKWWCEEEDIELKWWEERYVRALTASIANRGSR